MTENKRLDVNKIDDLFVRNELIRLYEENEQLKSDNKEYIKGLDLAKATSQSWASDVRELREENIRLKKKEEYCDNLCKSFGDYYGMNIENAEWFGFNGDVE